MSRLTRQRCATLALIVSLGLAGCEQESAGPMASASPITLAMAEEIAANDDAGRGNGYTFHVRYPSLQPDWNALLPRLRAFAAEQKKAFLTARSEDKHLDRLDYSLDLEFSVARRTADFVSVLTNGSVYTGGVHPNPILVSFNLHPADGKLIAIEDLFADPVAALKALSDESRRQLEGRYEAAQHEGDEKQRAADHQQTYTWIERGTAPAAGNFMVFLVDGLDSKAIGLTLIFPPYQVASYADGPQQVEVPAKVFYPYLKPEYRDSFAIDTEAEDLAPGVR
jgi:hypothetical protein